MVTITHAFESTKAASTDASLVNSSDWNNDHNIVADPGTLLGNNSTAAAAVQDLDFATVRGLLPAEELGVGRGTNPQSSNYTLALTDAGKTIEMTSTSANTLTVPSSSSVAFGTATYINIMQYGAGVTTISAGSTAINIRSRNGLVLGGQYAMATIYKRAANEWVAGGDLTT